MIQMNFFFLIVGTLQFLAKASAFQCPQQKIIPYTVKERSSNDNDNIIKMNMTAQQNQQQQQQQQTGMEEESESEEERQLSLFQSQRRNFLRDSMSLLIASSTAMAFSGEAEASTSTSTSTSTSGYIPDGVGGLRKPKGVGGLTKKIRKVGDIMDELQRDLMQERWDLVEKYPDQLRSFVPVFTTYTDAAFPADAPTDGGLRVALRYEVGRFFASVERLKQSTSRRALDEAYLAYSDMALHFDRYLHVGGLYTYYDATITNEDFFKGVSRDSLVYSNTKNDPALVRDLIVITNGPDMGKTGIVIGSYKDGSNNCVVKLDRYMGLREIRVIPTSWAGKRLGEQDPDDVFLIVRNDK